MNGRPNIVLVHGAWADGSCWSGVIERLQADGFQVTSAAVPVDIARRRRRPFAPGARLPGRPDDRRRTLLRRPDHDRPGHGRAERRRARLYRGVRHRRRRIARRASLQGPVTPALAHLFTDARGFGWLSEDDFVNHFAADVEPTRARVLYAVQQPLAASAFTDVMGVPAWKSLPSWYLVAENDEATPARRRTPVRRRGWDAATVEIPFEPPRPWSRTHRGRGPHREGGRRRSVPAAR